MLSRDLHQNITSISPSIRTAALPPIAVDLDGTLTLTDTLVESVVQMVRTRPLMLLLLPVWLTKGVAYFKRAVAERTRLSVEILPYRLELISFLRDQRQQGRRIILSTAADRSIGDAVGQHLQLFDAVLATDGVTNLKGQSKFVAIRAHLGDDFVYAGDSRADIPIWLGCGKAILAGASARTAMLVRKDCAVELELPSEHRWFATWLRAIRVHQWAKNSLLFVPLLTGFYFQDFGKIIDVLVAFLAFSLLASSTYILNHLWDLPNDRLHPRKRLRPIASGDLPILHGLFGSLILLGIGLGLAIAVSMAFAAVLMVYLVLTCVYSWVLKSFVLLDVLSLSMLYTIRIIAGAVCVGAELSSWLLAFSVFMFFSLALVKRCSELVTLQIEGKSASRGRDYLVNDLVILWPMGAGAALCSTVILGLFISSPETASRYASPQLLWLSALGLMYWMARLWIKTARGEMHDDPVVFALKDRGSRLTIAAVVAVVLGAHFLSFRSLL